MFAQVVLGKRNGERYRPQVDGPGGCLACGSLAACTSALLCALKLLALHVQ